MKQIMLCIWLSLVPVLGFGQTTLQTVDFETTSVYVVTGGQTTSPDDWWERASSAQVNPLVPFSGYQGSYFFYAEDTDNGRANDDPAYCTLSATNVSSYTNLQVKIMVAGKNDVGSAYEREEYLRIQYAFDGGTFTTRSQFIAANVDDVYMSEDANADGIADGPALSPACAEFTYSIPSAGSNLQIRIMGNTDQAGEEFGFDNIRVLGTLAPTGAPAQVVLYDFYLQQVNGGVSVCWQTASEEDAVGFDVFREENGAWVKVNTAMIPAEGWPNGGVGASYCVADAGAKVDGTYRYKLVEYETTGKVCEYGPFERSAWLPRLSSFTATPAGVVIQWQSRAGELYDVLKAVDARGAYAPAATGLPATPPVNAWTDPAASAGAAFYRIEAR